MKESVFLKKILPVVMTLVFVLTITACGNNSSSKETDSTQAASSAAPAESTQAPAEIDKPKEPVTLTLLVQETGTKWNNFPDNPIAQEIKKQTGVTIQYVESDESKYKVLIAGGDLPDIIRTNVVNDGKQLVEGGVIIPLDELLQTNGQNILRDIPTTVEFSKKLWSYGTGKLYFLPPQLRTSETNLAYSNQVGVSLRWDYYKEIGAPVIKTSDDLLNVLAQMQENHPKTDDGKKVYGVSSWSDWGMYVYIQPMYDFTGDAPSGESEVLVAPPYQVSPYPKALLTDPESNYWKTVEFFYKAKKMGLLDPDALTMKYDDYMAKATAGQILYGPAEWAMGSFNAENAKNGIGFMSVPIEGGYSYSTGTVYPNPIGWRDKSYAISKNCKIPDRAMDFLNYIFSYEGARTMWSGIEGVNWTMEKGVPVLTADTIKLRSDGGENWDKSGIQLDANLLGFTGNSVSTLDSRPVNLFETPENYAARVNPLERDYCDFYKVTFPGEIFRNMTAEGRLNQFPEMDVNDFNQARVKVVAAASDDIKKMEAKLTEMAMTNAAKAVLAKSDADFAEVKAKAISDFEAAGSQQVLDWYLKAIKDAREAIGLK